MKYHTLQKGIETIEWTSDETFGKLYKSRNLPRSGLLEQGAAPDAEEYRASSEKASGIPLPVRRAGELSVVRKNYKR